MRGELWLVGEWGGGAGGMPVRIQPTRHPLSVTHRHTCMQSFINSCIHACMPSFFAGLVVGSTIHSCMHSPCAPPRRRGPPRPARGSGGGSARSPGPLARARGRSARSVGWAGGNGWVGIWLGGWVGGVFIVCCGVAAGPYHNTKTHAHTHARTSMPRAAMGEYSTLRAKNPSVGRSGYGGCSSLVTTVSTLVLMLLGGV